MEQIIKKVIDIEWKAQNLQKQSKKHGSLIQPLIKIQPTSIQTQEVLENPINYIIIQGSFDPPTVSHLELISKVIQYWSHFELSKLIEVIILFSLAHVDKKTSVLERSLLGYRVDMLEYLCNNLKLTTPITIGLSNMARYIDLIKAIRKYYKNINTISFIMGFDVFQKLLDPNYYVNPLEETLPEIFNADYFVAGRKEIFLEKEFIEYLDIHLNDIYNKKVKFISMSNYSRQLSSTQIRKALSKNQPIEEKSIHPSIMKYLKKNNLYRTDTNWVAKNIAIQISIKKAIKIGKLQTTAFKILESLLLDIEKDTLLQKRIIDDYKANTNREIIKRWNNLLELIS